MFFNNLLKLPFMYKPRLYPEVFQRTQAFHVTGLRQANCLPFPLPTNCTAFWVTSHILWFFPTISFWMLIFDFRKKFVLQHLCKRTSSTTKSFIPINLPFSSIAHLIWIFTQSRIKTLIGQQSYCLVEWMFFFFFSRITVIQANKFIIENKLVFVRKNFGTSDST